MIIEFEIKEINNEQAILVNDSQESLTINLKNLPKNAKIKDKVMIAVTSAQSNNKQEHLAKAILNELLSHQNEENN